ncbi:hypothetical protein HDU99_006048, partial [Rhizoclosmatium hyalinum]
LTDFNQLTTTSLNQRSKPRVAIVSYYGGKGSELVASLTFPNKIAYASYHDYTFHDYTDRRKLWPKAQFSGYFDKFKAILDLLHQNTYDWVFWTDTDSIFLNRTLSLTEFLDPRYDIILPTTEPSNPHFAKVINSGHFLVRNSAWSRGYLTRLLAVTGTGKNCTPIPDLNVVNGWLPICDSDGEYWQYDQGALMWSFQKWGRDVQCHVKSVGSRHLASEWPWYDEGDLIVEYSLFRIHLPGREATQRVLLFTDLMEITDLRTGNLNHSDPRYVHLKSESPSSEHPSVARLRVDKEYVDIGWNRVCGDDEGELAALI